jgi:hypothetical protein
MRQHSADPRICCHLFAGLGPIQIPRPKLSQGRVPVATTSLNNPASVRHAFDGVQRSASSNGTVALRTVSVKALQITVNKMLMQCRRLTGGRMGHRS